MEEITDQGHFISQILRLGDMVIYRMHFNSEEFFHMYTVLSHLTCNKRKFSVLYILF